MTTKRRFPLALAEVTAQSLVDLLAPACQRIEVAGSIRRGRPDVGDVELLCVPRFEVRSDLFGQPVERVSLMDRRCRELVRSGHLDYRPNKAGALTFGPMNKLMLHQGTGIPLDLFTATAENWGMFLFVRTGRPDSSGRRWAGSGFWGWLATLTAGSPPSAARWSTAQRKRTFSTCWAGTGCRRRPGWTASTRRSSPGPGSPPPGR